MIFRLRKNRSKGFTLIEVMVVVAIIAILASLVGVSVAQIRRNSQKKAANTALTTYWNKTNEAFRALNLKVMRTSNLKTTVATYLGMDSKNLTIDKNPPSATSLGKGMIHIQYKEDKTSLTERYTLVKIWYNSQGKYYSTNDGKNCTGPDSSPK